MEIINNFLKIKNVVISLIIIFIIIFIVYLVYSFLQKYKKFGDGVKSVISATPIAFITGDTKPRDYVVANCPASYTNNGLACGRGTISKSSDSGMGIYESADCPPSYTNTGTTCHRWGGSSFQRDYFSKFGKSIEYDLKKCEERYGKNNCEKKGIYGTRLARPKTCEIEARYLKKEFPDKYVDDNLSTMGSRCYLHPHTLGSIKTHGICPPQKGYNDKEKQKLKNYTEKRGALCYVDCKKKYINEPYGKDMYNNGTSCWADAKTISRNESTCPTGTERINVGAVINCYKNCPTGYSIDKIGKITCVKK